LLQCSFLYLPWTFLGGTFLPLGLSGSLTGEDVLDIEPCLLKTNYTTQNHIKLPIIFHGKVFFIKTYAIIYPSFITNLCQILPQFNFFVHIYIFESLSVY
jgi:hypothetical protein